MEVAVIGIDRSVLIRWGRVFDARLAKHGPEFKRTGTAETTGLS